MRKKIQFPIITLGLIKAQKWSQKILHIHPLLRSEEKECWEEDEEEEVELEEDEGGG